MKKKGISKFILIFVLAVTVICTAAISTMSVLKYNNSASSFSEDGYMLLASDDDSDAINEQYYFSAGENYRVNLDDNITFTDINGNKVSAEKENFVHYTSGSMNGLSESVVLNADNIEGDQQVSYYSVPAQTTMTKNGNKYTLNNAGNNINFSNFLWKISNNNYMIVSETIDLIVSEESAQSFNDYVELRYIDEGVAHLVTQDGTYSTISSDAYLLLANGIRIYIGSKNVSNDEEILMNLTQMVVGSDDNIEVIPDEDYTVETDKTPQIVVNATDGEAGTNGDEGELGQNGENGDPGVKGSSGAQGTSGTDAANAGIVFDPEVLPLFTDVTCDPSPYGVSVTTKYDSNDLIVGKVYVSIVDLNTGYEVWRKDITNGYLTDDGTTVSSAIECKTLAADNDYSFNIWCAYKKNAADSYETRQIVQEYFKTDSYGFSLTKLAVTTNSITVRVTKEQASDVSKLRVNIYGEGSSDAFGRFSKTSDCAAAQGDDNTTKVYDVSTMNVGDYITLEYTGLTSNTVYYGLIDITDVNGVVPTVNTYTKQKFLTLKRDPDIEKPTVIYDVSEDSFVITPGIVIDEDHGITNYVLEIYEVNDDDEPYYTYDFNSSVLTTIQLPLTNNTSDKTKLQRQVDYYARYVATFNNNEEILDFRGNDSDIFTSDTSVGATISFTMDDDYSDATVIQGSLRLINNNNVIPSDALLNIYVRKNNTSDSRLVASNLTLGDMTKVDEFEYRKDIAISALQNNEEYVLYVTSSKLYKNGTLYSNNQTIGSTTFKLTNLYDRLYLTSINTKVKDDSQIDLNYSNYAFAIELRLSPKSDQSEKRSNNDSLIAGLAGDTTDTTDLRRMSDFSGRSVTTLKLELYDSTQIEMDGTTGTIKTVGGENVSPIATKYITDSNNSSYTSSKLYAYNYTFNSSIYQNAYFANITDANTRASKSYYYSPTDKDTVSYTPIIITDQTFFSNATNVISSSDAGTKFYIKVTAYDYLYGVGESTDVGNDTLIVVGDLNDTYSEGSDYDSWLCVTKTLTIPNVPEVNSLTNTVGSVDYQQKGEAVTKIAAASYVHSNVTDFTSLQGTWTELNDNTDVGVTYTGPNDLASYCSSISTGSVIYNVYRCGKDNEGNATETLVHTSGKLQYTYSATNDTMPSYTFFYDVPGINGEVITRGDEYFIETQIVIKGFDTGTSLYPNDFYASIQNYDANDIRTYRIFDNLFSLKQAPEVYTIPYSGSTTLSTSTNEIYRLIVTDPDKTIAPYDGTITVSNATYTDSLGNTVLNPIIGTDFATAVTEDATNGWFSAEGIRNTDYLTLTYCLYSDRTLTDNIKYKTIFTATDITSAKEINLINLDKTIDGETPDTDQKIDLKYNGEVLTIKFQFQSTDRFDSSSSASNELLGTAIKFTKYYLDDHNLEVKGTSKTIYAVPNISVSYRTSEVDDPNNEGSKLNEYIHTAIIKINTAEYLSDIIIGNSSIDVDLSVFYDSGNFGTKYLEGSTGSSYYIRESLKSTGEGISSSMTNYPSDRYTTRKISGINYDSTTKLNLPIFEKSTATYDVANLLISNNYGSGKSSTFSISEIGLIDQNISPLDDDEELSDYFTLPNSNSNLIIKNVSSKSLSVNTDILRTISTSVQATIISGYETALITFTIPYADTFMYKNSGDNYDDLTIRYRVKGTTTWFTTQTTVVYSDGTLDSNTGTRTWTNAVLHKDPTDDEDSVDAEGNKIDYEFQIVGSIISGNTKSNGPLYFDQTNNIDTKAFNFTTFVHNDGKMKVEAYTDTTANQITRDSKRLVYTLSLTDYIDTDITSSLSEVMVAIFDDQTEANFASSTDISFDASQNVTGVANALDYKVIKISDIVGSVNSSSPNYVSSKDYNITFEWDPSVETTTTKNHIMKSGEYYYVRVLYRYSLTGVTNGYSYDTVSVKAFNSVSNDSNTGITGWTNVLSKTQYIAYGSKYVYFDDLGGSDYRLIFNITGTDTNKILSQNSSGKLSILFELYEKGEDDVLANDSAVYANLMAYTYTDPDGTDRYSTIAVPKQTGNAMRFVANDVEVGSDGKIKSYYVEFAGLKAITQYEMKMYYVFDGDNIDLGDISALITNPTELLDATKDIKVTLDGGTTISDLSTVADSSTTLIDSKIYTKSVTTTTESTTSTLVGSISIHPENQCALIIGSNLDAIKYITYELRTNDGEKVQYTVPVASGTKIFKDEFYEDMDTLYILDLPMCTDTTATYTMTARFYTKATPDFDTDVPLVVDAHYPRD